MHRVHSHIKGFIFTASAAVLSSFLCLGLVSCAPQQDTSQGATREATEFVGGVSDIPDDRVIPTGRTMPLYLQDDPQWANLDYATGSIETSGCGLVSAAMAIEYQTNQICNPRDLDSIVGNSCCRGEVSDMGLFCDYIEAAYGLECSDMYEDLEGALADVEKGAVVFASVSGKFGYQAYGGHIVLMWLIDGDSIYIRDPASGYNSQHPFTREELEGYFFRYFFSVWPKGGSYGA